MLRAEGSYVEDAADDPETDGSTACPAAIAPNDTTSSSADRQIPRNFVPKTNLDSFVLVYRRKNEEVLVCEGCVSTLESDRPCIRGPSGVSLTLPFPVVVRLP